MGWGRGRMEWENDTYVPLLSHGYVKEGRKGIGFKKIKRRASETVRGRFTGHYIFYPFNVYTK